MNGAGPTPVRICDELPRSIEYVNGIACVRDDVGEMNANGFADVPIANLATNPPKPPIFVVPELVPAGAVTLLGAHGGTGKSLLALECAVCLAMGLEFLGREMAPRRVLFYSAEDPAEVIRWRLLRICRNRGIDPADLAPNLRVIDATESDPTLYAELYDAGIRRGTTTSNYERLRLTVSKFGAGLVVIDNASDCYDGDENNRPRVRAFIRVLAAMVKPTVGAVLLIAHVDKTSARGFGGSESYSGSTAWHNSVRSRLFLGREKGDDALVLKHEKSNHGRMAEPIRLEWTEDGLLVPADPVTSTAGLIGSEERSAVMALISEYYGRGEYLPTSQGAPNNAFKVLSGDQGFPARLDRIAFYQIIRDAERSGLLVRERFKTDGRKERERWAPR